ncbi:hypothetical protein CRENBAI_002682 [Crenichthys baileyi]|uniref:Uncharacterized protein n=1 Tax=Crenichthys baileyi TaxID=28760 RepID=A0AAV9SFJ9_9TELE
MYKPPSESGPKSIRTRSKLSEPGRKLHQNQSLDPGVGVSSQHSSSLESWPGLPAGEQQLPGVLAWVPAAEHSLGPGRGLLSKGSLGGAAAAGSLESGVGAQQESSSLESSGGCSAAAAAPWSPAWLLVAVAPRSPGVGFLSSSSSSLESWVGCSAAAAAPGVPAVGCSAAAAPWSPAVGCSVAVAPWSPGGGVPQHSAAPWGSWHGLPQQQQELPGVLAWAALVAAGPWSPGEEGGGRQ